MATYLYTMPDGSKDRPDENGNHTATANVRHSAEGYARFPGCPSCCRIAETSCPVCYHIPGATVCGGFDEVTETFASVVHHGPDGRCGNVGCGLCMMYAAGWCSNCKEFTRKPVQP